MRLRPFFSYYGSKYRLAPKYPEPKHQKIIEPFAGSACYSLSRISLLFPRSVQLYDKNPKVCMLWDYLIHVTEKEILSLPILKPKQQIPTTLPIEAQLLIGFWASKGTVNPVKTMTAKTKCADKGDRGYWSAKIKFRIANQLQYIRHWTIENSCYTNLKNEEATWFIDPPYAVGGHRYTYSQIDYNVLSTFCRNRIGQTIVCENGKADWLPFVSFKKTKGLKKTTEEVMWTNENR